MKKFIISLLFVIIAVGANAQVTYNVRVGGVVGSDEYGDGGPMAAAQIQCNIPFRKGSHFTFSPSVILDSDFDETYNLVVPLTVGYKIIVGHNGIFFPKVGVSGGVSTYGDALVGPAVGLDYEYKHLVVGLNWYRSSIKRHEDDGDYSPYGVILTVGYKF